MSNNQLPANVQSRIEADAQKAADAEEKRLKDNNHPDYGRMVSQIHGYHSGYIAGTTAEREQAQKLVDALSGCIGTIIFWYEVLSQTEGFGIMEAEYLEAKNQSIKRIETALQQWKGEGKEVGDEKE